MSSMISSVRPTVTVPPVANIFSTWKNYIGFAIFRKMGKYERRVFKYLSLLAVTVGWPIGSIQISLDSYFLGNRKSEIMRPYNLCALANMPSNLIIHFLCCTSMIRIAEPCCTISNCVFKFFPENIINFSS